MLKERPMQYFYEDWLLDLIRSECKFLRQAGVWPYVVKVPAGATFGDY